jgi:GNAT acetyltransferase-like protein
MATASIEITQPVLPHSSPSGGRQSNKQPACEYLRECDYSGWDRLVKDSPHGTVFHSSWWLQVSASSLRILVVRDGSGQLVGGIPLTYRRAAGLDLIHAPALTPYLGPIFDLSGARSTCEQLHLMRQYGEVLARAIGPFDSFRCMAGACAPDLQGFLWAGFQVSLAYTFRFFSHQKADEITKGMTRTHLQKLSKARRLKLTVTRDREIETLLELRALTYQRKGIRPSCEDDLVLRLWRAGAAREQANLYIAKTEQGRAVAGLFTVHDRRATYQIVSGFDPEFPDVPGQNLVLWAALQDALNAGRDFDFEGSSLRGVETFYRRWGSSAVPVWRIEKAGTVTGNLALMAMRYQDSRRSARSHGS